MTIQEAARRSGLSAHTLRYYERAGLVITPVDRTAGGRRRYHQLDLDWIYVCTRLRATGMPIQTIRRYAELVAAGNGNFLGFPQDVKKYVPAAYDEVITVTALAEIPAGAESGMHRHPGEEVGYVVEGAIDVDMPGKSPMTYKAGQAFLIPAGQAHNAKNAGSGTTKVLANYIPTEDGFVPRETQAAMHAGLDDHPKVTLHDYEGLDHGFATEHGKRRDEEAARVALVHSNLRGPQSAVSLDQGVAEVVDWVNAYWDQIQRQTLDYVDKA